MFYLFHEYALDTDARELRHSGTPVPLTLKTYQMLAYLLEHRDRLVLKDELLEHVWPNTYVDDSAVKRCIMAARRALGESSGTPQYIKTMRGQGYRFIAPVTVHVHPPSTLTPVAVPAASPPVSAGSAEPEEPEHAVQRPSEQAALRAEGSRACPSCSAHNTMAARFCMACGTALVTACPACRHVVAMPATFCTVCGQRLPTAAPAPASDTASPSMLDTPMGERKLVTVLCGSIANASALLETLGLDAVHSLMQDVYTMAVTTVQRYAGTMQAITSEGFVALFGAPVAYEDHAHRALLTAQALQRQLVDPQGQQGRPGQATPAFRLAMHTGLVVVGQVGPDLPQTSMVVGDTTSIATALAQTAAPGTVIASAATLRMLQDDVHLAELPAVSMDGYAQPIAIAQILDTAPPSSAGRGARRGTHLPLIGRDTDLALLRARLARARAGQGQVVGIMGEPGIGKSRLLYALHQEATACHVVYRQGRCQSHGSAIPYGPLIDLLRTTWALTEHEGTASATAKIHAGLQAVEMAPETWAPYFFSLLNLTASNTSQPPESPDVLKARTFEALHQLILRWSQQQPCVLALEDMHWADATSEAYLSALVERVPGTALLLVTTFRPGHQPSWLHKSYATQIALQPLTPEESLQLVHAVMPQSSIPLALAQQLCTKAEGNPFYLEELAQTLREQSPQAPGSTIPETIQAVIAARLDRLPPAEKTLLQIAATLGPDVPFALLQTLTDLPAEALQHRLAALQTLEFLYETRLVPERVYTFKHVLTHEVTYGSMLHAQRRTWHTRIVAALEAQTALHGDDDDRLAYHARLGEMWDKASAAYQRAGLRASARSAHREAVTCFEHALEALQQLPGTPERHTQAIDLRFDLRNALLPLGGNARILQLLHEAEVLAERLDDARRLGWIACYQSTHAFMQGDCVQTLRTGQRALALAEASDDVALQITTYLRLGQAHHALGAYAHAIDLLHQNITVLQGPRAHERFGLAGLLSVHSYAWLAWCCAETGAFVDGRHYGEEAVRVATAAERPYDLLTALGCLGVLYLRQGDLTQAATVLEHALTLYETTRLVLVFPLIAGSLGMVYALAGQTTKGLALLEQSTQQADALGLCVGHALWHSWLAWALLLAGRFSEAQHLATQVLEYARSRQERGQEAYALWLLGESHPRHTAAQADAARVYYQHALEQAHALGMQPLLAQCSLGLGLLCRQQGQEAAAHDWLDAALSMFQTLHMPFWITHATAALTTLPQHS